MSPPPLALASGVWGFGFRVLGVEDGCSAMVFGVRGLVSDVCDLEFGIWSWGLAVGG